jgi:hypothetical protein
VQTFDSLDFARYSDDGDRQTEERVAGKWIWHILLQPFRSSMNISKLIFYSESSQILLIQSHPVIIVHSVKKWFNNRTNLLFQSFTVLEFELRKAHDTIKSLRSSLTKVTETELPSPERSGREKVRIIFYSFSMEPVFSNHGKKS